MMMLLLLVVFSGSDDSVWLEKERRRFVGEWVLVETVLDGEVKQDGVGGKTVFAFKPDGTYVGKVGDSVIGKGTFKPVPGSQPAAVDWTAAGRQEFDGKFTKEMVSVGIYRFDKDELTVAMKQEGKAAERPKGFESKKGSGVLVLRMRRVR